MTYKELAQKINALTEDQQNQEVSIFGEAANFNSGVIEEDNFDEECGTHKGHGFFNMGGIKLSTIKESVTEELVRDGKMLK